MKIFLIVLGALGLIGIGYAVDNTPPQNTPSFTAGYVAGIKSGVLVSPHTNMKPTCQLLWANTSGRDDATLWQQGCVAALTGATP